VPIAEETSKNFAAHAAVVCVKADLGEIRYKNSKSDF